MAPCTVCFRMIAAERDSRSELCTVVESTRSDGDVHGSFMSSSFDCALTASLNHLQSLRAIDGP